MSGFTKAWFSRANTSGQASYRTNVQRHQEFIGCHCRVWFLFLAPLYLYRAGHFHFETNTVWHVLLGLIALNVWNEIHFYLVHRLMHTRFFMANVHHVHHRSRVPTVKSVYSFHWFEALLLSTVPLTLGSVWPLAPLAIAIYPLNSLLFNFAGHCNYRLLLFKNTRLDMASRHIQHHRSVHISYGFVSSWLDRLFKTQSPH